jgi:phosphohistidine phosphatase SixA
MRLIFLFMLFLPSLAAANDWSALQRDGAIAIMRHALAPGGGDPSNHTIDDCSTQRNLSEAGRTQARNLGDALRARDILFDTVYTSQWCRTRDTASLLGFGTPVDAPALNSFFQARQNADGQTRALRGALASVDGLTLWVTHQVNISALTGTGTRSGEMIVFRLTDTGTEILGRILIDP